MQQMSFGFLLGIVLSVFVFLGYTFKGQDSDLLVGVFYLLISSYLFAVGFLEFKRTNSIRQAAKTTCLTGFLGGFIVSIAFFLVHNIFFFEQTSRESEKILGLKNSGLKTMRDYLLYNSFRVLIFSSVAGIVGGFVLGVIGGSVGRYFKK